MDRKIVSLNTVFQADLALVNEYKTNIFKQEGYIRKQILARVSFWKSANRKYARQLIESVAKSHWFKTWEDLIDLCKVGSNDLELIIPLLKNFINHYHAGQFKPTNLDSVDELPELSKAITPLLKKEYFKKYFFILNELIRASAPPQVDVTSIRNLSMWFDDNRNSDDDTLEIFASGFRDVIHRNLSPAKIMYCMNSYFNGFLNGVHSDKTIAYEHKRRNQYRIQESFFSKIPELYKILQTRGNGIADILNDKNNSHFVFWDESVTSEEILEEKLKALGLEDIDNIKKLYRETYHEPMSYYEIARELQKLLRPITEGTVWEDLKPNVQQWVTENPQLPFVIHIQTFIKAIDSNDLSTAIVKYALIKQHLVQYAKNQSNSHSFNTLILGKELDSLAFSHLLPAIIDFTQKNAGTDESYLLAFKALGAITISLSVNEIDKHKTILNQAHKLRDLTLKQMEDFSSLRKIFYSLLQYSGNISGFLSATLFNSNYPTIDSKADAIKNFIRSQLGLYMDQLSNILGPYITTKKIVDDAETPLTKIADVREIRDLFFPFNNNLPISPLIKKDIIGNKGIGLANLTRLKIPTPPGVILSNIAWGKYKDRFKNYDFPKELMTEIKTLMKGFIFTTGKKYGSKNKPLFLSVRSSPRKSMPGILETFLFIGLNDTTVKQLVANTLGANAYKYYSMFIAKYLNTVLNVSKSEIDAFKKRLHEYHLNDIVMYTKDIDIDLVLSQLTEIDEETRKYYQEKIAIYYKALAQELSQTRFNGQVFPQNQYTQLANVIMCVFNSWDNEHAKAYREFYDISDKTGTSCIIQQMVFGFKDEKSGSGVLTTRDSNFGQDVLTGEFKHIGIGPDVVDGTSYTISDLSLLNETLKTESTYTYLTLVKTILEREYKYPQDIEFTVQKGQPHILQTRKAILTDFAKLVAGVDMYHQGILNENDLQNIISSDKVKSMKIHGFDAAQIKKIPTLTRGMCVGNNIGVGRVAFSSKEAQAYIDAGFPVVLVKSVTSDEDNKTIPKLAALLTSNGGPTSHAAINARFADIACVVNAPFEINMKTETFSPGAQFARKHNIIVKKGDWISVDGSTGKVYQGQLDTHFGVNTDTLHVEKEKILNHYKGLYFKILKK
ncbi:MAG: hypothetical protein A2Y40_04555 [Candidatus Margulisbacteria bacterium GWF2_35_9]|nr:MAG: hypothetical protein A2Y40_04555 [Candidatus Margulisbacteria bacterium GWF2_35_9]